MDLKKVLGENFKENMSFEDIATALSSYDPTAGMVSKEAFDKASSEAAGYKKQLRDKLSEEEKAEADRKAEHEQIMKELETLRAEKIISEHKANFLSLGYDDKLAEEAAKALAKGDMTAVFAAQKAAQASAEQRLRAELLDSTPRPSTAGDTGSDHPDFKKMSLYEKQMLYVKDPDAYKAMISKEE